MSVLKFKYATFESMNLVCILQMFLHTFVDVHAKTDGFQPSPPPTPFVRTEPNPNLPSRVQSNSMQTNIYYPRVKWCVV